MYEELLNTTVTIYRLTGYENYNYTTAVEGEVVESWTPVNLTAKCRIDRFRSPTNRRSDGQVQTGTTMAFFKVDEDVKDGDRIVANGKKYSVVDVYTVEGFDETHHKEAEIRLVDSEV